MARIRRAMLVVVAGVLVACGGGGNGGGSPTAPSTSSADLTGTYNGTFRSTVVTGLSGTLRVNLTQTGNRLTGNVVVSSSDPRLIFRGGSIDGSVEGDSVVLGVASGALSVSFRGTVSGNRISGTFSASNGDAGTWSITRT